MHTNWNSKYSTENVIAVVATKTPVVKPPCFYYCGTTKPLAGKFRSCYDATVTPSFERIAETYESSVVTAAIQTSSFEKYEASHFQQTNNIKNVIFLL